MAVIPDFGHVADFGALELHNVGIVRSHGSAGRSDRSSVTGLSAVEDG